MTRAVPAPAPTTPDRGAPSSPPFVVLKLGGTSVASPAGWHALARACRTILADGRRPFVVCSALAGVSTRIDGLVDAAAAGDDTGGGVDALAEAHRGLAAELGVPEPPEIDTLLDDLRAGLAGVALLRDASPRVRARLLAIGELACTHLGQRWLVQQGLAIEWRDARTLLRAADPPGTDDVARFLAAREVAVDEAALPTLARAAGVLTQGFVAGDAAGDTVLLGRGGSDTSAALFGAGLHAERVEIWTDVAGMHTANPAAIPGARPIPRLGYDEAEALSALGAKVLHPGAVAPLRERGVPLSVRSTFHPDDPGTLVSPAPAEPGVKAVSMRSGLALVRIERPGGWQPVGFLADVASCFARRGVSIDLLSTSPATIVATVDPAVAPGGRFDGVIRDLEALPAARVSVLRPVASVSLVGTHVRSTTARIGAALGAVSDAEPHMVCPGASDHHLTFVVDEGRAPELVERLHRTLFSPRRAP